MAKGKPAGAGYPQRLRIIGGDWRGRQLQVIESEGLRPTPDRVRETLFNWLQTRIAGAHCLDLFAGTGALCLESLSRGAERVVMVEKARAVAQNLRRNIENLGASAAELIETDAERYLQGPAEAFDIIFVDPPFRRSDLIDTCLGLIDQHGWIKPGGWVYIEAPSEMGEPTLPAGWQMERSKIAGQVGYHLARTPE